MAEVSQDGATSTAGGKGVVSGLGEAALDRALADACIRNDAGDVTTHALAKTTGIANSNTPRILNALADRGLVWAGDARPAI